MATPTHFLHVRKSTHQGTEWSVQYDLAPVGIIMQSPGWNQDFCFEWGCTSSDLAILDSFALQPQKTAAIGNRYEMFSTTTGEILATIKDHKWNALGLVEVSCKSIAGKIRICETINSKLGFATEFLNTEYKIQGPFSGVVSAEQGFGRNSFRIAISRDEVDIARVNAVILGCMIVLTRSLSRKTDS